MCIVLLLEQKEYLQLLMEKTHLKSLHGLLRKCDHRKDVPDWEVLCILCECKGQRLEEALTKDWEMERLLLSPTSFEWVLLQLEDSPSVRWREQRHKCGHRRGVLG